MPGVADAERRTRSSQEQSGRKRDREDLLLLLSEGRLHEADAHQLEQIKLALELSELLGAKQEAAPSMDVDKLAEVLKVALSEAVAAIPTTVVTGVGGGTFSDPSRPKMKHTSLTSIEHGDTGLDVVGGDNLAQELEGEDNAAEKLKRLKELKGSR